MNKTPDSGEKLALVRTTRSMHCRFPYAPFIHTLGNFKGQRVKSNVASTFCNTVLVKSKVGSIKKLSLCWHKRGGHYRRLPDRSRPSFSRKLLHSVFLGKPVWLTVTRSLSRVTTIAYLHSSSAQFKNSITLNDSFWTMNHRPRHRWKLKKWGNKIRIRRIG